MSETPRKRGWLKPLLFISLALNLLIVGIAVGWLSSSKGPRHSGGEARALGIVARQFVEPLSEEQRRALARDVFENRDDFRQNRRQLRGTLNNLLEALRTTPFDADAIQEVLTTQRAAALNRQQLGEQLLIKRIAAMTDEERAIYADNLEERFKRFKRRAD